MALIEAIKSKCSNIDTGWDFFGHIPRVGRHLIFNNGKLPVYFLEVTKPNTKYIGYNTTSCTVRGLPYMTSAKFSDYLTPQADCGVIS